jgi:hypothetical protein
LSKPGGFELWHEAAQELKHARNTLIRIASKMPTAPSLNLSTGFELWHEAAQELKHARNTLICIASKMPTAPSLNLSTAGSQLDLTCTAPPHRGERGQHRHRVGDVLLLVLAPRGLRLGARGGGGRVGGEKLAATFIVVAFPAAPAAAAAAAAAVVCVEQAGRDEAHELRGGHLGAVGRAAQRDDVPEQKHVDFDEMGERGVAFFTSGTGEREKRGVGVC